MEDFTDEFQKDFLAAVKELEGFSSSDTGLKGALQQIRDRVDAKKYVCAPNFWEDLRASLQTIEQERDEKASKTKAQLVLKQIARLEVKFWVKESVSMLCSLDPDFRLERMVDWIKTFEGSEAAGDQSSGPAVLYKVLSDISIQKDMDSTQREALMAAVRENLHKFPVAMQATLERVGSLTGASGPRGFHDFRRRSQPTPAPAEKATAPTAFGASALGGHQPLQFPGLAAATAPGGLLGSSLAASQAAPMVLPKMPLAVPVPKGVELTAVPIAPLPAFSNAAPADEDAQAAAEDDEANEGWDISKVDPKALERARRAVVAALASNGGSVGRQHVRTLLKQVGIAGVPIAALGEEIFFSGSEVFTRRHGSLSPDAAPAVKSPVPQELRSQMAALVRDAGGRITLAQMAERLQWQPGSVRHKMHGPLRRALGQVTELFFEPQRVFSAAAAAEQIAVLAPAAEAAPQAAQGDQEPALYIADPFAELVATIYAWLHNSDGMLDQQPVLALVKALAFKTRSVIAAVANDVFWSHTEADVQVLLRTTSGAAQHPKPLPDVYLHPTVKQNLLQEVRSMGAKPKVDHMAGKLGWNAKSELRKAYGALRIVLGGLREVFYDGQHIYLKRSLDGIVEWPVGRNGRLGPNAAEEAAVRHWTPEADDLKNAGDPDLVNVKRQVLGMVMSHGGRCDVAILRRLLASLKGEVALEELFQQGTPKDLTQVLFWSTDVAYAMRPEAAEQRPVLEDQVPESVRVIIVDTVRRRGYASLAELKALLDTTTLGEQVDEGVLSGYLLRLPEVLFAPEVVFLRHVATSFIQQPSVSAELGAVEAAAATNASEATAPAADAADAGASSGAEGKDTAAVTEAAAGDAVASSGIDESAAAALDIIANEVTAAAAAAASATAASDDTAEVREPAARGEKRRLPKEAAPMEGKFFSFSNFATEAPIIQRAPVKRARTSEPAIGTVAATSAEPAKLWSVGDAVPLWVTEGAAVLVRDVAGEPMDPGSQEGVIVRVSGGSCIVRLSRGALAVERELATHALLPVTPAVGANVKVVAGDRSGCYGMLVGLAGGQGVVQIGKMSYETMPMNQLAVLAS